MNPRSPGTALARRGACAALLTLLVAVAVGARQPAAQPPKKDPDKKDPDKKDPAKPPEIKWPTDINGKDIYAVMKDMESPDPTIREFAARTIAAFGPPAQKGDVSKLLLRRMVVERDPGVRGAVYNAVGQLQFENEADNVEALRLLAITVDTGLAGGTSRQNAVQTIAMFGPKGEPAVTKLVGTALNDPSYETRRSIAHALGRVGFNETTGPNMRALTALADRLARDESASVRMEALQSLMLLGPPWAKVRKPDDKTPPEIDTKNAATVVGYMRRRIGDPKTNTPGSEKDKQCEIWARLVLMRLDPTEVNEENLDAIANHLSGAEVGVRAQALQAIGLLGEKAGGKVTAVIDVMEDKNAPFQLTVVSIQALMAMGAGAKPALPNLKKMAEEKKKELAKTELELAKKKDDLQLTREKATLENMVKLLDEAIKQIDAAKSTLPGVSPSDPAKKP